MTAIYPVEFGICAISLGLRLALFFVKHYRRTITEGARVIAVTCK